MKDVDRREQVAEEIAIKLYEKGVRDIRQLIDVIKLYSIQKTKLTKFSSLWRCIRDLFIDMKKTTTTTTTASLCDKCKKNEVEI